MLQINTQEDKKNTLLANRWHSFKESIFSEMSRLAQQEGAINLGQGAPDFYGPQKLLDSICQHIKSCHNQYSSAPGEKYLREQLSEFIKRQTNVAYDPETEITVTCGASEALFCALNAFLSPDDKVILFEPAYDVYSQAIANTGAELITIPMTPPDTQTKDKSQSEWLIDWDAFDRATKEEFKCIIINTPHNPTGKVFSKTELQKIGESALKKGALILSDEVYENLSYEKSNPYQSIASFPKFREITIRISSSAKIFGFTGLKIGWAAAPQKLTHGLRLVHQSNVFCVNPALQLGLADCLADTKWLTEYLHSQKHDYKKKRQILSEILEEAQFILSPCYGTFFLCANYQNLSNENDSITFAKNFIKTHKIATIPLASFYSQSPKDLQWVRFAFCKSDETLCKVRTILKTFKQIF